MIAYATGFQANKALWPRTIIGRYGEAIGDRWGERPTAYLGITASGYPNFFCMYGPGTNLASGGILIFHSECQMRYIAGCLEYLTAGDHWSMEPRADRCDAWVRRSEMYGLSPWRLADYWTWTRAPDPGDFVFG